MDLLPLEVRGKVLIGFHPRCHAIEAENNTENLINRRSSTFANIGQYGRVSGSAANTKSSVSLSGGNGSSSVVAGSSSGSLASGADSFCGKLIGNAYSWTLSTVRDVLCSAGGVATLLPLLARCTDVLLEPQSRSDLQAARLSAKVLRIIANMSVSYTHLTLPTIYSV